MAVHATTVEVDARADLELWVRRGEAGGVSDGVESVLTGIEAVEAHDVVEITGVRPMANELRVNVTVDLTVRVTSDDPRRVTGERLADGFGVTDVAALTLDTDN